MLHTGASEGKFYIGGFVLLKFVDPIRLALIELAQYKTAYLELVFARPNAAAFSSIYIYIYIYIEREREREREKEVTVDSLRRLASLVLIIYNYTYYIYMYH